MTSQLTLNIFEQAANRFTAAVAEVFKDWQLPCNCQSPGEKPNCQNCPYFKELVELIQAKLHPAPAQVFPIILPPEIKPPYHEEVKQQCLDLHKRGYPLEKIQRLTGVTNRQTLRRWIRQAGQLQEASSYSMAERQRCVNLYVEGMSPSQIEFLTGVPADLIRRWTGQAGVSRPRTSYSDEQKQQALALYKEGRDVKEIEALTGVYAQSVRSMAKRANLYRPRRYRGGRPPVHSPQVKQSCHKLLQEGKSPPQIEELLGVSADTIRKWKKEWEQTADGVSPVAQPNTPDEANQPG
ncbi:MAG: helix-turn-helix domain-containing protein [Coleofasciculus sp. C3-bin4]|nr:helix-turn-helix domain-containing protein [Coleofasciculus sp. Co-bin14]MBD0362349.1 helix-turn-helix domain-containing protein [Coleofasciculus sp. C3-bin4]